MKLGEKIKKISASSQNVNLIFFNPDFCIDYVIKFTICKEVKKFKSKISDECLKLI